jgi:hypothetical protein
MEKSKQPNFKRKLNFRHRLGNVIQAFINIGESLIMILTFSGIMVKWTGKWIIFRMGKGKKWFWGQVE